MNEIKQINLLPQTLCNDYSRLIALSVGFIITIGVSLFLFYFYDWLHEARLDHMLEITHCIQERQKHLDELKKNNGFLETATYPNYAWNFLNLLNQFDQMLPTYMKLQEIQIKDNQINLLGWGENVKDILKFYHAILSAKNNLLPHSKGHQMLISNHHNQFQFEIYLNFKNVENN